MANAGPKPINRYEIASSNPISALLLTNRVIFKWLIYISRKPCSGMATIRLYDVNH